MSFQSLTTNQKNKTFAPILLGIAILATFLWVFPSFSSYSDNSASLANLESNLKTKEAEYEKFKKIEEEVQNETGELSKFIKKISQDFVSSEILSAVMINRYTQPQMGVQAVAPVTISNISLDRGKALPSGIYQGKISMTVSTNSVDHVVDYLTYLTTNTNFAFTLGDITLPVDTLETSEAKTLTIPVSLGLYYYP